MMTTIQLTNECNEKVGKFKNLVSLLFVKFKGESRNKEPHFGHTFLLGGGSGGGESTHF